MLGTFYPLCQENHPEFLFFFFFFLATGLLVAGIGDVEKGNQLTGNISSPSTIQPLPFTRYLTKGPFRKEHEKKKSKDSRTLDIPAINSSDTENSAMEGVDFAYLFDDILLQHHPIPTHIYEQKPTTDHMPFTTSTSTLCLKIWRVGRSVPCHTTPIHIYVR